MLGKPRIVIFTDDPGWHAQELKRAFSSIGREVEICSLTKCRFDSSRGGLVIPGFETRLPEGAFVRQIGPGSLEQVVMRLDILHALAELGVPVYNSPRAIERSVDKAMTSFLLHRAGVPTPPFFASEDSPAARVHFAREASAGRELVIKPLFGSMGNGLARLSGEDEFPDLALYEGVAYLQAFIDSGEWHDFRVFVVGGRALSAMIRRGLSWINNVAQGGRPERVELDSQLANIAVRASTALHMDYAGIDIVRGHDGGYRVLEVNGIPAWKGLQQVSEIDLAQALADDFVRRGLPRLSLEAAC
ncbi:MAG TPA: RimK family alpha-L-glutamate ligase [Burkholderiales bacterium]|nr:RimK family alpha-L-glutamate ligase [Burkholderiales bacterium]